MLAAPVTISKAYELFSNDAGEGRPNKATVDRLFEHSSHIEIELE